MRTPLLRSLRRLISDFRIARATGLPVDEIAQRRQAALPRRRDVLKGAAAVAAGALVSGGAQRVAHGLRQPTIAIVGGGIAGLSCALELADRGVASTVYEASGRIGGRMFSNNRGYWDAGQVSEWCGELIDTGHETVRGLAKRFGLPLDDLNAAQASHSTDTYRFFNRYYSTAQADADFGAIVDALNQDVNDAPFPTTFDSFTPAGFALDHMSVFDWIEARVPGGHRSPLGALLDAAYTIEYGADTTVQSSLNLIYLLGFQPDDGGLSGTVSLFGESDERFHIRGGNQQLPQAIARHLGDAVFTGWKLARVARGSGGRVQLTFDTGTGPSQQVTADIAVLAIPFAVLRELDIARAGFSELKTTAIDELGRGHNGKLHLQFDERLWSTRGPWGISTGGTYADTGYQSGWDVSRAQPGQPGVLVFYSGGSVTDAMATNAAFTTIAANPRVGVDARRALDQIAPVFPGLPPLWNGKATQSLPHKLDLMKASYSYWRVGQYTQFSGIEGVPERNVYFCGEHTSQDFQGFMEGGASTGVATADAIADRIGARPSR